MVRKNSIYIIAILLFSLFSISLVLANFNVPDNGYSIKTVYGPEFPITGWINISFDDEPLDSVFEDSFDNNISLEEALDVNPSYSYSCDPVDCGSDYISSNAQTSKTLSLGDEERLIGLKLTGNVQSVDSVSFNVSSNSGAFCGNSQVEIDVLDDGKTEVINSKTSGNSCPSSKTYGCFNSGIPTDELVMNLNTEPYCEKVNISSTPKVEVGAWIKNESGQGSVSAQLFNSDWVSQGSCNLQTTSSTGEEVSCEIDLSVGEEGEYYACVFSDSTSNDYKIQGYDSGDDNYCGFYGVANPVNADYRIFVIEKEFAPFGEVKVNNFLDDGTSLSGIIEDYISNRYGAEMDCGSEGCIVPINVISSVSQQITFKNLALTYTKTTGSPSEDEFWSLTEIPATATSQHQKLYLDNFNFLTSDEIDEHDYSLSFDGSEIFEKEIEIKDAPIIDTITPKSTASAISTKFTLILSSESNITDYVWSFGDNSPDVTTLGNSTTHTYNSTGEYNLSVSVTDTQNLTSRKTFKISVSLPLEFINNKISNLNASITSINEDISDLSVFQKQGIKEVTNLDFVESELERIKSDFESANNETEYNQIVNELLPLELPDRIIQTKESNNFVFIPKSEDVNLDVIQSIAGGEYSNEEAYKEAVTFWQQSQLSVRLDLDGFSQENDETTTHLISFFNLNVNEKNNVDYPYYAIIPKFESVGMQGPSSEEGEFIYKQVRPNSPISFYVSEDLTPLEVPVFFSPSLNRLEVSEELVGEFEEPSKGLWIVAALLILSIIFVFAYIIMKEWYKRKYESSLFKDRNDLYNMVNYVNNAKKKDLSESEIRKNLKDAGWSNERIRYVMKKYGGKNTGMFDPVEKIMKKFGKE